MTNKNALGMDEKTASWFAYLISIISAIMILATDKDRTVRLHAWQSLFLGCLILVVGGVLSVIAALLGISIIFIGISIIISIVQFLLWMGFLVLTILCILKALQGDILRIPVLYEWAQKMR